MAQTYTKGRNRLSLLKRVMLVVAMAFAASSFAQSITDYTFTASSGTYTPLTGATAPALTSGSLDEGYYNGLPIGFSFCYMGQTYTTFSASTNGWATFGTITSSSLTNNLTSGGTPRPVIAPLWDDNEIDATGSFSYLTTGAPGSRVFTAEWNKVQWNWLAAGPGISFQVKLYEATGNIEFVYTPEAAALNSTSASVGITATATGAGNFLSVSALSTSATVSSTTETTTIATAPTAGLTFTFAPPIPATPPTNMTFSGVSASAMTVNWVDASTSESAFTVWRSTDNVTFTQVATIPSTSIATTGTAYNYAATGLFNGTLYYWRVYAVNANCGNTPLAGSQSTLAGTMCGTMTIGPTGTYPTLTAAVAALQTNGLSCPVIMEFQAAYVSSVEPAFPVVIPSVGASSVNTVTIRPELGATNIVLTSAVAQTIQFNGANYISFDGRPGGVGTNRELTITNTSTTGVAVNIIGDATNCGMNYCKLTGANTSATSGIVVFGNSASSFGQSGHFITNCDIYNASSNPTNCIYSSNATAGAFTQNVTISNNLIHDWFSASAANTAINAGTGSSLWTISNNSFYQTATRTYTLGTSHVAINIASTTGQGFVITGNYIGGSAANCGGSAWAIGGTVATRFTGIAVSAGTTTASSVQGNTITNFTLSTSSGATTLNGIWCGISVTSGSVNIGNTTANVIGSTTANNAVVATTTTSSGLLVGINYSAAGANGNISNNQIGGLTCAGGSATIVTSVVGIITSSTSALTINNNLIGSMTMTNSLLNAAGTAASTNHVTGILTQTSGGSTVTNNTVMNLTGQSVSTSTGAQVRGIVATSGINTITGNTVRNLANTAPQTGTTTTSNVLGISQQSASAGQTVSGNTIENLANGSTTGAVTLTGLYYTASTTGTNTVSRNTIRGIGAPLNTANVIINGILINGGTSNIFNNIVILGVDATGASLTNAHEFNGILKVTTSSNNIYHNSVNIAGTGVATGTMNSSAFRRTGTGTDVLVNNVFTNMRSNATTGGAHYAINLNNTTTLTADKNCYFVNGTGGVFGIVGATTYPGIGSWIATGLDLNSVGVNPNYISATTNLHINNTSASALESRGNTIAVVTNDIDNDVRPGPVGSVNGGGTAPDLGADEFDGIPLAVDMSAFSLTRPMTTGCHGAADSVVVRIKNNSSQTMNFATHPVVVHSYTQGINPQVFPNVTISSGTLAAGGTQDVTVSTTYNMTAAGTHIFRAYTEVPDMSDVIISNDSMGAVSISVSGGTFAATNNGHLCLGDSTRFTLTGYTTGGSVQWQSSPDNLTWTNIPGATLATNQYITPNDTLFYRAMVCGLHASTVDTLFPTYVAPPTTVNDTICGPGQVNLSASGSGTLYWYNAPTGGTNLNTGTTYSPNITSTTTYYVENATGTSNGLHTTTFAAGNGSSGNMFTITALNTITITGFDGHMTSGTANWEIWYMPSTMTAANTTSSAGWTLLGSAANVTAAGLGVPTPLPITLNVTIPAGATYSFYVTTTASTVNYTNGTAVGNVYNANADLQFREGYGGGYFSVVNSPRVFNGRIHYSAGCSSVRTAVVGVVTPPPAVTASPVNTLLCTGATDSTLIVVTGGSPNYAYTWTPATNLNTATGDSVMFNPATPGLYTYYIDAMDASTGCHNVDTLTMRLNVTPLANATVSNDSICRGTPVTLDAVASVTNAAINAGTLTNTTTTYPCIYGNWFEGSRHQILYKASDLTAAGLSAGYIGGLRFGIINMNASVDSLLNFTISMAQTSLTSLTTTFQTSGFQQVYTTPVQHIAAGGNTHMFQTPFFWDGVSNIIIETCYNNNTNNSIFEYTENVTMRYQTVAYNAVTYAAQDNSTSMCTVATGTTLTSLPNILFIPSTASWTHAWTPASSLNNANIQSPTATPLVNTTYTVMITDSMSGCFSYDSVFVYIKPTPSPNLGPDTIICSNQPLLLDGTAGNYTYLWQDSATTQTYSASLFGYYSVNVTDTVSGCAASDTVLIGVNAAPSFSLGSDVTVCAGTQVTFSGPGGQYSYGWNTSDTTQAITAGTSGSYELTVTDTINGCFAMDTVALTVNPLPVVGLGNDTSICSASSPLILTAPSGNYTYNWSDNSTNDSLAVVATGTYYVVVTDTATTCFSGDTIMVSVNSTPVVSLGNDSTQCGGSIMLMAPAGPFNYLWSDNSTGNTLTVSSTGMINILVTDSITGCASSDTVSLTINTIPVFSLGNDTSLCGGTLTLNGPVGSNIGYLWQDNSTSQSLVAATTGNYALTATDTITGCNATDSVNVTINTPPTVTFSIQATACTTDPAFTLTGSPAGGVFSGPGVTGNSFSPATAGVGTHTITYDYTDANGCSGQATDVISVSACVGISDPLVQAGMNVFPNPNNGLFTLTIKDADYSELTVEVVTVEGKVVYSDKASSVQGDYVKNIDLTTEANGIYFLRITANGQTFMQKIVKNN